MSTSDRRNALLGSCLFSILASIVLFLRGQRESAIFVGLWAPTILSLDSFLSATPESDDSALQAS